MTCAHTITKGRPGETGSWCIACGVKVMAVHDRPCGECRFYREDTFSLSGKLGFCTHPAHSMTVTRDMHVTYYVVNDEPWRYPLCFEEIDA